MISEGAGSCLEFRGGWGVARALPLLHAFRCWLKPMQAQQRKEGVEVRGSARRPLTPFTPMNASVLHTPMQPSNATVDMSVWKGRREKRSVGVRARAHHPPLTSFQGPVGNQL